MPRGDEHDDLVDALLEECLAAPLAKQHDVLKALAAANPEMAAELRARYGQLRDLGLLQSARPVAGVLGVEPLSEGRQFGDFRILRELGRGGMGVVYLAEQVSMGRKVALKLLRGDVLAHPRIRQRFQREVEAASSLEHPGISTIYEAGEVEGTPYIAMRYVSGETLRSRIHSAAQMTDGTSSKSSSSKSGKTSTHAQTMATVHLIEQVARALHYAHERGFIHRDVKPGNVMVSEGDEPVLLDFGLARPEESTGDSITVSGDALGTPAYMSPEQISPDGRRIDRRTDVYSLGVTLFEYLTGRTPFEAPTREELYRLILTTGRVDTGHTRLPRDLHVVLDTALARERNRRYQTALDFAEDLRRIREHKPIKARRASPVERAWRWTRREPLKAALLVIVPLLCLLGGYVWARSDEIDVGAEAMRQLQLDVALARGFMCLFTGSLEAAEVAFREARSIAPEDREAAAGLALVLLDQGKKTAGEALTAELGPASVEARCVNAWLATRKSGTNQDDSLELLPEPRTATEHFLFGWAVLHHLAVDNYRWQKRAQAAFLKAITRSERARMHYHIYLVWTSGTLRDAPWIRAGSQTMAEIWPDQPLAWAAMASALARIDPGAAHAAAKELERWPEHRYATCIRGHLAFRKDPARAARLLQPALGTTWIESYKWCADAFWEAGDTDRAVAVLKQAVTLWPSNLGTRFTLAWYQRDYRAAEAVSREMIKLHPMRSSGYVCLSSCLSRRRHADALKYAQRAVELNPNNSGARRRLASVLFRAGQRVKARRIVTRILKTDPGDPSNWRTAAQLAMLDHDYANAAAFYRRVEQMRPARTDYYNFGLAEMQVGHLRQAAHHYRKSLARKPTHAESFMNLGASLEPMGDLEGALSVYEKGEALGSRQKGWRSRAPHIAKLRETLRTRAANGSPEAKQLPSTLDEAVRAANLAYWNGEDGRCVAAFRQAVSQGMRWPENRYTVRWAAHAAIRIGDPPSRNLARRSLDKMLRYCESKAVSAKPPLRRRIHQELYSWLTHERLAPVREGTGLEKLPETERTKWQSFWKRVRTLVETLDPFHGASGILEVK